MLVSSSPGPDCIVRGMHNNQDALVLEYKVKCKSNVSNKFNLVSNKQKCIYSFLSRTDVRVYLKKCNWVGKLNLKWWDKECSVW